MFHRIITVFFRKSNFPVIVFKYKVFDFFDCHLSYNADYLQNIHHYMIEKHIKRKQWSHMGEKIAYKNGDNKQFKVILDKESLIFES